MDYKTYLIFFGVVAVAVSAQYDGGIIYGDGVAESGYDEHKDYYAVPSYNYEYKVHDGHTGDVKTHHESREGDVVKGYYSLLDADGTTREVHYTADKHNGFNAEVKKIGHAVHEPAPHTGSSYF